MRVLAIMGLAALGLIGITISAMLTASAVAWLAWFDDSVTLPNGMILKREFNFTRGGRDDLFASDGRTVLARDIEFVCFNDRYVDVYSYSRGDSGLYDGVTDAAVPSADRQAYDEIDRASGLRGGRGCNGYYTGVVGPDFFYGGPRPFQPSCDGRNLGNESLADRSWFDRPCDPRPSPRSPFRSP